MIAKRLERLKIPIAARTFVYAVVFLGVVLAALPWATDRAGRAWLPSFELGALRFVGWALFGVALAVYLGLTVVLVRRGGGPYVEFDPPRRLVTTGPYAWSRNPIVVCVVAMLLGLGLAWSSTGVLLLAALVAVVVYLQVTRFEEPRLRQRFGEAYETYTQNVPRWLPRRPRS